MNQVTVTETRKQVSVTQLVNQLGVVQPQVTVVEASRSGPPGAPGVSGDKNYVQAFTSASNIAVAHNLGKYPAVTITDSAGDEVLGEVRNLDTNNLTVTFSAPFSGTISCN